MTATSALTPAKPALEGAAARKIKCVVWDLDHTIWDGVLLENENVTLRPGVREAIEILDSRGILHSIASRNELQAAMARLREFGLAEYFLFPQINWNPKSDSVRKIAQDIGIGTDTLAFVDDQPFERAEVAASMPEVLCLDSAEAARLPQRPEMQPLFITEDSRNRRQMYRADSQRQAAEEQFKGVKEEFLAGLQMRFHICRATENDLQRAEELTVRTHQLNSTGYTYSYDELRAFSHSVSHQLLIASLDDRFGSYGKIGLALVETQPTLWTLKLLLVSCRVISRGLGTVFLNFIMAQARRHKVRLQAELVPTERNRMMHITYKFAGFKLMGQSGPAQVFESDLTTIQEAPPYVQLTSHV
jgi:FkbH-like protein